MGKRMGSAVKWPDSKYLPHSFLATVRYYYTPINTRVMSYLYNLGRIIAKPQVPQASCGGYYLFLKTYIMQARCLVQSLVLLLPISVSYYYPSCLALLCSSFHDFSSPQRFTLDYYTQSITQLYFISISSSLPVNEISNFRTHSLPCHTAQTWAHKWEFKTPEGGLQMCAKADLYGL